MDAGVWLAAYDPRDRLHPPASALLHDVAEKDRAVAALDLTFYEVANVAVVRWRAQNVAREIVLLVEQSCDELLLRANAELVGQAAALAARHGLTAYDAAYVAASRQHGWQLVSCDMKDLVEPGFAVAPDAVL